MPVSVALAVTALLRVAVHVSASASQKQTNGRAPAQSMEFSCTSDPDLDPDQDPAPTTAVPLLLLLLPPLPLPPLHAYDDSVTECECGAEHHVDLVVVVAPQTPSAATARGARKPTLVVVDVSVLLLVMLLPGCEIIPHLLHDHDKDDDSCHD